MANQEQVDRLLTGVEGWNKWRAENPDELIDLSGANLSRACFYNANLSCADLSDASILPSQASYLLGALGLRVATPYTAG